jgi:protein O-GlcNAc transferase
MLGSTWHSPRRSLYFSAAAVVVLCLTSSYFIWRREEGLWGNISRLAPGKSCPSTSPSPPPAPTPTTEAHSVLEPPAEYLFQSEDQRVCEEGYGTSYLKYIASHQQPYCQPESRGALQCFSAPRLQAPWHSDWKNDTLCVAQGVRFGTLNIPPKGVIKFFLHCQARNLTRDALASTAKAEELMGYPELHSMPTYWFDTGTGPTFRSWDFDEDIDETGCSKAKANHEWILVARREHNVNIWHKMAEIWQARHTIDALQMSINPSTGQPWLTREQAATVTVVFEDDREEPLDHLWTVATGNKPIRMSALTPGTCFGNIIIPLAGSSSPFWTALLEDVYHETCRAPVLLTAWVRLVFNFLNTTTRSATDVHAEPTITIVERARNRKFAGLDRWVGTLKARYPKSTITVADFAAISLEEQLNLIQQTDIYVGHHGAAMAHTIFLPSEAAVVEILPPVFPMRGFRSLARMRGLSHFGANSMWPEEWNQTVNGVPIPEGWVAPKTPVDWQSNEWTYMTDDQFLGLVDAAVRNQQNKRFQFESCAPNC